MPALLIVLHGEITSLFKELPGADKVTRIRKTMEMTWQAFCSKDGKDLGYFVLYEEE